MKISTLARKSLAASAIIGLATFGSSASASQLAGLTTAPQLTALSPLTIVSGDWLSNTVQEMLFACKSEVVSGSGAYADFLTVSRANDCSPITRSVGDTRQTLPTDLTTAIMYQQTTPYMALTSTLPHVVYVEDAGPNAQTGGTFWTGSLPWDQSGSDTGAPGSGQSNEQQVVSYEGPLLASATGRNAVAETAGTLSFKGKRLNLVTGATIGGIAVTVASASKSALELTFESLPAGKHDVVLTSKSGAKLTLRGFVTVN